MNAVLPPPPPPVAPPDASRTDRGPLVRARWIRLPRSLLWTVVLPTLLATLYFVGIASDQYVAEARFAVRSNEPVSLDLVGAFTGLPAQGSSAADAYIVRDYILSRQGFESLAERVPVREIYSRPEADWWARLDPEAPVEDVLDYWKDMIDVGFEATTGISRLEVRAFRPEDARAIAAALLVESEALVNRLSERARHDAVALAEGEVQRAEARLAEARRIVTEFRNQRQMLDPTRSAEGKLGLVTELEGELARAQTELSTLKSYMQPGAAPIVSQESRILALKQQLVHEQHKLAGSKAAGSELMSTLVSDYQRLSGQQEFAERLYVSALTGLEAARAEALRQHRYLVTFVDPRLPEEATRPRRLTAVATVFAAACVLWSLGALIVAAVKEHAGWV